MISSFAHQLHQNPHHLPTQTAFVTRRDLAQTLTGSSDVNFSDDVDEEETEEDLIAAAETLERVLKSLWESVVQEDGERRKRAEEQREKASRRVEDIEAQTETHRMESDEQEVDDREAYGTFYDVLPEMYMPVWTWRDPKGRTSS